MSLKERVFVGDRPEAAIIGYNVSGPKELADRIRAGSMVGFVVLPVEVAEKYEEQISALNGMISFLERCLPEVFQAVSLVIVSFGKQEHSDWSVPDEEVRLERLSIPFGKAGFHEDCSEPVFPVRFLTPIDFKNPGIKGLIQFL